MDRRRFLWLAAGAPFVAACSGGGSRETAGDGVARVDEPSPSATVPWTLAATSGIATATATATPTAPAAATVRPLSGLRLEEFPVVAGSGPHDVAPAPDGRIWYTGQRNGTLGIFDPATGRTEEVRLGQGSAPHGVIAGPDGAAWITDGGLDALVRYEPGSGDLRTFPLPGRPGANLNTAAFDGRGRLWFTGQAGYHGRVDPATATVDLYRSPRGRGPYGICATPAGDIYYASLAGNHIARVNLETGEATPIEPSTPNAGPRRIWSDSRGMLWVSEWNAGQLSRYDPVQQTWRAWKLPGTRPQCYSVYVDDLDRPWVTDFGANAILVFDQATEQFRAFPLARANANVRQMLGRPGEAWGAASGYDALVVVR